MDLAHSSGRLGKQALPISAVMPIRRWVRQADRLRAHTKAERSAKGRPCFPGTIVRIYQSSCQRTSPRPEIDRPSKKNFGNCLSSHPRKAGHRTPLEFSRNVRPTIRAAGNSGPQRSANDATSPPICIGHRARQNPKTFFGGRSIFASGYVAHVQAPLNRSR